MVLHILFVNVISTAVMLFSSLDCNQRNKNLFQCKPVTTDLILMFYMSGLLSNMMKSHDVKLTCNNLEKNCRLKR